MSRNTQKTHLVSGYRVRPWHARFWHGMRIGTVWHLLVNGGFRLSAGQFWQLPVILPIALFNSVARVVQHLVFSRKVAATELAGPPLFIIGHWRSGTTLLHELMMLDAQFTAPTTYQCMCPNHFLMTASYADKVQFLLPGKRPMDGMQIGWHKPQEDEFALMNMGQPSPYCDLAFPHAPTVWPGSLSLKGLDGDQLVAWNKALDVFLRRVTLQDARPIVVKSPTHTARVKALLEAYPDAKFIFIHRDPEAVYASTVKLWGALEEAHGLQRVNETGLPEKVLSGFEEMFDAFNHDCRTVPSGQFASLSYEELVADPTGNMRAIYVRLGLSDFDGAQPAIEGYFAEREDYRADRYELSDDLRQQIADRWGPHVQRLSEVLAEKSS